MSVTLLGITWYSQREVDRLLDEAEQAAPRPPTQTENAAVASGNIPQPTYKELYEQADREARQARRELEDLQSLIDEQAKLLKDQAGLIFDLQQRPTMEQLNVVMEQVKELRTKAKALEGKPDEVKPSDGRRKKKAEPAASGE